jgi:hypothetical protein
MLKLHIERIGDMAVIHCEGRIVQSDATFKLRESGRSNAGKSRSSGSASGP